MRKMQMNLDRTLLAIEELRTLLKEAKNTDMELPVLFMVSNGLRTGEVIGLRWRNIDFENKVIHMKDGLSSMSESGKKILEEKDFNYIKIVRDEKLNPYMIPYLDKQKDAQKVKRESGNYYANDLVISKEDGSPILYNQFATKCRWLIQKMLVSKNKPLTILDIRYSVLSHVRIMGSYEKYWDQVFVEALEEHTHEE